MVMETQLVSPGGDDVQLLVEAAAGDSDRRIGKRGVISEGLGSGGCNRDGMQCSLAAKKPWQFAVATVLRSAARGPCAPRAPGGPDLA